MSSDLTRRSVLRHAIALGGALAVAPLASAASPSESYRLGPGDRVRVIVFTEDQLTGEFVVSGAGALSLPLIGDVQAAGMTTPGLQAEVTRRLKAGYIKDPRVSVEVLSYRPFYILGEVVKPGEYPFANNLTVLNAVATANGFTYRADVRRVYVKHAGEAEEHLLVLDSALFVQPGDTIRIRERYF